MFLPLMKAYWFPSITSWRTVRILLDKTLQSSYKGEKSNNGLEILNSSCFCLLKISRIKVAFKFRGIFPLEWNLQKRSRISCWMMSQQSLKKAIEKPSGSGALSDAIEKTASFISANNKGFSSNAACSAVKALPVQLENHASALWFFLWFFVYIFWKCCKTSSLIRAGSSHKDPSM